MVSPGYRYGDLEVLQVSERCVRTLHHLDTSRDLEVLQVSERCVRTLHHLDTGMET